MREFTGPSTSIQLQLGHCLARSAAIFLSGSGAAEGFFVAMAPQASVALGGRNGPRWAPRGALQNLQTLSTTIADDGVHATRDVAMRMMVVMMVVINGDGIDDGGPGMSQHQRCEIIFT